MDATGLPHSRVDPELWFRSIYSTPLLLAGIADLDGRVLDANELSVEGLGLARRDVVGQLFWDGPWWGTDDSVREFVHDLCLEAAENGGQVRAESAWWLPDGSERWVDLAIHRVPDDDGRPAFLFLSGLDITEQTHSLRALRAAESRLATSLQLSDHILDNVADGIYGLDLELHGMFANRAAEKLLGYRQGDLLGQNLHQLLHRQSDGSPAPVDDCPAVRALRTGEVITASRETFRRGDARLIPIELTAVPTLGDDGVTGVVVSFRDISERIAAERHVAQLRELAEREQASRALSDRLQQALLTRPPEHADIEVAVRYRPASAQAKVGGDWYDAFSQPDGATMLVIGDVIGHDTLAVGAMAQFKGVLRGIAYGSTESPAQLMARFDTAARGLGITALATVLLVRVDPAVSLGGKRLVTWTSAGHLSPAIGGPGPAARSLPSTHDLLLGVDPSTRRVDHTVELAPGSTLLLYTDGLIERRDELIDSGIARLLGVFAELAERPLDELCDALLQRLVGEEAQDDIAVLAAR